MSLLPQLLPLLVALTMLAGACRPPPPAPPHPDAGTGGAMATGGSASIGGDSAGGRLGASGGAQSDGLARCIAATKSDPGRAVQARDYGITVTELATLLCSYAVTRQCFASGVCR
jgi:hypothetical protein